MTATNLTIGGITIYDVKVEYSMTKELIILDVPVPTSKQSQNPDTRIGDLLKVQRRFTVNGFINGSNWTNIRNIVLTGGVHALVYDGNSWDVQFEKCTLTEEPQDKMADMDSGDTASPTNESTHTPKYYAIMFSVIEGTDLFGGS